MNSIFNQEALEEFRKLHKLQPFKIKQIYFDIIKNSILDFNNITTLSRELREQLSGSFEIMPFQLKDKYETEKSTKFIFQTHDNHLIESVVMYHYQEKNINKKLNRLTLCVSTQVGCPIGCKFCWSGKITFIRNLEFAEILGQLLFANHYLQNKLGKKEDNSWHHVRNVVFMGIGEPLLNYHNLVKSINYMLDQQFWALSRRHITISTCGLITGIRKILDDNLNVKLAISLHGSNQQIREQIMPIAASHHLSDLLKILDQYILQTNNRIFIEYIMIKDLTDQEESAWELIGLFYSKLVHINLIPYNQSGNLQFQTSPEKKIWKFKEILESRGITVTVRDSYGKDIQGACGQLGRKETEFSI